jgi:hypothetical protein
MRHFLGHDSVGAEIADQSVEVTTGGRSFEHPANRLYELAIRLRVNQMQEHEDFLSPLVTALSSLPTSICVPLRLRGVQSPS